MKIFLVGSGTGGHFYPLIAVAEVLRHKAVSEGLDFDIAFMGPEPYDAAELTRLGIRFVSCPAGKVRRYLSLANLFDFFKTIFGVLLAFLKLLFEYPDVIFSKGGYTSVPILLAAWVLRIPVVVHESDAVVGRATKLGARFAKYIAVSYADVAGKFPANKTALTGIPIREVMRAPLQLAAQELPATFNVALPTVLVIGGSSGAERINLLITQSLDTLLPSYNVIHQTGKQQFAVEEELGKDVVAKDLQGRYLPLPYLTGEEMHRMLTIADVIISRSGSGAIFEIALHEKPSILIPIPETISHDQVSNAYAYGNTGAATVLEEENMSEHVLYALINEIMNSNQKYVSMVTAARNFAEPNAAEMVAEAVMRVAQKHR